MVSPRFQLHSVSFLWVPATLFLLLAGSWFVLMELLLQRPAFEIRAAIAGLIVIYAVLCLSYSRSPSPGFRSLISLFAVATLVLGVYGLRTTLHAPHFEGYRLVISFALVAQSLLTLTQTLPRPRLRTA